MEINVTNVEEYLDSLRHIEWFEKCGSYLEGDLIKRVDSWEESYQWAGEKITEWCDMEARSRVYKYMSEHHYDVFSAWNDVARSILPLVVTVVNKAKSKFPVDHPGAAALWLQCQLMGASTEIYYSQYFQSDLYLKQLDLYRLGHFPCGWYVPKEEAFPDEAIIIVY